MAPSIANTSEYGYDGASAVWYPDSGATNHVSNDLGNLNISSEYHGGKKLMLGNGLGISISHIGQAHFKTANSRTLLLNNLLHVPDISKNLLSVSQFAKDNKVFFEFHPNVCFVKDLQSREIVLKGILDQGLYKFLIYNSNVKNSSQQTLPAFNQNDIATPAACSATLGNFSSSSSSLASSLALWHQRLGHTALNVVKLALSSCNLPFQSMNSDSTLCHPCCVAKAHRLPYNLSNSICTAPLQIIHSDLWGPSPVLSRNGYSYYVAFVDQFSRYTWIYLLKHKNDVLAAFKQFKAVAENSLSCKN